MMDKKEPNTPEMDKREYWENRQREPLSAYEMSVIDSKSKCPTVQELIIRKDIESVLRSDSEKDYSSLRNVLEKAYDRAAKGKGKDRHADGLPFEEQPICRLIYSFGEHCWDGQIGKKMAEADVLSPEAGDNELLDCIVYIAGRLVARQKRRADGK